MKKIVRLFLLHISPISKTENVINLLGFLVIDRNAHISIFPGPACKASETGFDYTKLTEELEKLNNDVVITPIIGEHGNIFIFGRDIYLLDQKNIDDELPKKR